jgi:hypothetical protein
MAIECDRSDEATAYVLGELEGAELSEFKLHLRGCAACTEEVELLESAAEAVPLLATRQTPREQEPVSERSNAAFKLQQATDPLPRLRAIAGGGGEDDEVEARPSRHYKPRRKRRNGRIPTSVTITVAALLVVAMMTYILTRESNSIAYIRAEAGWTGGGAVVKVQGSRAELLVADMPAPPANGYYEVWLRYKHSSHLTATSAKVGLNSQGEAAVGIPADIQNAIVLAVYEEREHGPRTTNSGAVIVADLRPYTETTGA